MRSKIINGIEFRKSTRQGKKYMAKPVSKNTPWVHFGALSYQHFKDVIGFYKHLDHGDAARRKNYRTRHKAIKNSKGVPFYKIKGTAAYYSYYYLW